MAGQADVAVITPYRKTHKIGKWVFLSLHFSTLNHTNQIFTNPTKKQTEDYITGRYG